MIVIITTIVFIVFLVVLGIFLKKKMFKELVIGSLMSLVWVIYYQYNYSGDQWVWFTYVNTFAWVSWTLGLVLFAQIYEYFKKKFKQYWKTLILSGATYLGFMVILEWVGYNVLQIRTTVEYGGLFGLPLLHGIWWMKVYYLTAWLTFIGLYELWGLLEK